MLQFRLLVPVVLRGAATRNLGRHNPTCFQIRILHLLAVSIVQGLSRPRLTNRIRS